MPWRFGKTLPKPGVICILPNRQYHFTSVLLNRNFLPRSLSVIIIRLNSKAGTILFAHAEKILALYDEAARSLAELREESILLRIAATNSIAKYAMPAAI